MILRNLTLAAPEVNRFEKSGKDAGEWLPARNHCWFAGRVVEVRRVYGLTVDRREAAALERILAGCGRTALEPVVCAAPSGSSSAAGAASGDDALARYDDSRNGRITCAEARPARNCAGAAVPSGASQHARCGRGWRCL